MERTKSEETIIVERIFLSPLLMFFFVGVWEIFFSLLLHLC